MTAREALRQASLDDLLNKHAYLTILIHETTSKDHERDLRAMRLMVRNEVSRRTETFAVCDEGHRHWGPLGAAGLLLASHDEDGNVLVLLHHRAKGNHHPETYGWPGGAIEHGETPEQGARREAAEEAGLTDLPEAVLSYTLDHGGWAYQTFVVFVDPDSVTTKENWEGETAWFTLDEALDLPLVPGAHEALTHLFPAARVAR